MQKRQDLLSHYFLCLFLLLEAAGLNAAFLPFSYLVYCPWLRESTRKNRGCTGAQVLPLASRARFSPQTARHLWWLCVTLEPRADQHLSTKPIPCLQHVDMHHTAWCHQQIYWDCTQLHCPCCWWQGMNSDNLSFIFNTVSCTSFLGQYIFLPLWWEKKDHISARQWQQGCWWALLLTQHTSEALEFLREGARSSVPAGTSAHCHLYWPSPVYLESTFWLPQQPKKINSTLNGDHEPPLFPLQEQKGQGWVLACFCCTGLAKVSFVHWWLRSRITKVPAATVTPDPKFYHLPAAPAPIRGHHRSFLWGQQVPTQKGKESGLQCLIT